MDKWDKRFLELAETISTWSKDPSTKVGALIVRGKNNFISLGYNGFPSYMPDFEGDYIDRSYKLDHIIHAEENAILNAKGDLTNCTIYTYPMMPCHNCMIRIGQAGIKRVVSFVSDNPRWQESIVKSLSSAEKMKIQVDLYHV